MIYDKKRICIASIHTANMNPLAEITWDKNKKIYCDFKGYSYEVREQATWRKEEYKDLIKIIPQKYMNAYPYSEIREHPNGLEDATGINGDWKPGDLIIHVAGFGIDFYKECVNHLRSYNSRVVK
jgi:hypothetical protein